jgi:alpha-L-fucosidase
MTMPTWWSERRLGLFVHATVASVPAWAPIGEYAEWYRSHLGDDVDDVLLHPRPLVEVLAHHRDRWGHVEHYDDFVPLLAFERFDAEAWAELASDAGAGYSVLVTKHHDGWTWWDAPGTERRLTEHGPRRNVLAEFAAACERHDILLGTSYSLLDWGDERYPDASYVDEVLHPQVVDLVDRYGPVMLWGDGHWAHDGGHWRTPELLSRVRELDPELVVNDRWWASPDDVPAGSPEIVRTFEYDAPDDIVDGPWQLTRGIAHSFGYNRAERPEHHLTGFEIVALFTEVIAKGGHLLLNVGPDADGTIPEVQAAPLRDAGSWIRRFDELLATASPWTAWGDDRVRYLRSGHDLLAIDVDGAGSFDALPAAELRVTAVDLVGDHAGHTLSWHQDADGLSVSSRPPAGDFDDDRIGIAVYRITFEEPERPTELFAPTAPAPIDLAPLLAEARPGDIVQLGEGQYRGPAAIPAGVVLRGLGPGRTTISLETDQPTSTVLEEPVLTIGRNARLEHVRVAARSARSDLFARPIVEIPDDFVTMLGCTVAGSVSVGGDDVLLRAVTGQGVVADNADRLHVSRCQFTGNRWDVGVELRRGGGQNIESSQFSGHLCAIRLSETTGSTVRGNNISGRWWGVHVDHSEGSHVHGNRIGSTMRAVDIDGGTEAVVDGNAVTDGDSGCVVEDGASNCEVYGNHWDRCRIGLLAWDAVSLHHQDNVASSLLEPDSALVTGP